MALRGVLVSGGPGISAEATEGEAAAGETLKEQFTEKCLLALFGDHPQIEGLWVEAPRSRHTPQEAGLKMHRSLGHSR